MSTELVPVLEPIDAPPAPQIHGSSLIDAWLDGRKASTVKGYQTDLALFGRYLSDHAMGGLETDQALDVFFTLPGGRANELVLAYRAEQLGRGLSSATIARRLAAVKSLSKVARMTGRITWSIEVEAPRHEDRRDMSGPDDSERKKIVKALNAMGDLPKAKRDRALYALLFTMVLRRAEVLALDLVDVDFVAGTIQIRGKGQREKKARPLPAQTSSALGEWVIARGRHEGPLFTRTDRPSVERLTGQALADALKAVQKAAGLSKSLRPHGLRHAGITKLRELGKTDREVMSLSRHKNPQMLARYDDSKDKSALKMAETLSNELK